MSAKVTYTYAGSPLNFNFPSFDVSHIQVSVDNATTTNYTISNYTTGLSNNVVSSGGGGTVTFSPDIANGSIVSIFRNTPSDYAINFQNGATLSALELNRNHTIQRFRIEELQLTAGGVGPQGPPGPAGSGSITVSTNPPANPNEGDLWWNPNTLRKYVYYNDGDSLQWVDTNPPSPGVAPNITIGTVSSVTAGNSPTANITGTTPNLTLDLGIPSGGGGSGIWTQNTGTNPSIYYPHNVAVGSNTYQSERLHVNGNAQITGSVTANTFSGNGSNLTNIDADTLGGQLPSYYLSSGSSSISVGMSQPSSPSEGDLWWNPSTLRSYVYYNDGSSTQWVDTNPPSPGVAPNISIGTVSNVTTGANATASISGTSPNYTLNLGIPSGTDGVSPGISIGTVSTLSSGSNATASISGSSPSYTLNLGIPRGQDGQDGQDGTVSNNLNGNVDISNGNLTVSDNITSGAIIKSTRTNGSGSAFVGTNNCILSAEGGDIKFLRGGVDTGNVTSSQWVLKKELKLESMAATAQAANVFVTTAGRILKSSSSLRYKHTIEDYDVNAAQKFLEEARPVTFYDNNPDFDSQYIGFIAEEMEDVEPRYITRDEQGRSDGVQYASIVTTLTKICQMQEQRIKALEDRLNV